MTPVLVRFDGNTAVFDDGSTLEFPPSLKMRFAGTAPLGFVVAFDRRGEWIHSGICSMVTRTYVETVLDEVVARINAKPAVAST